MRTLEESAVIAMDGSDQELFPFLPYILQDLWEIGSDPETIIKLIKKHFPDRADLWLLDLGCGKGAVSIQAARQLACRCHGIDAIPEFIAFARQKATEFKVEHLCTFEVGDIRSKKRQLSDYDLVILGSIGPVLGDYYQTLTTLEHCLNKNGAIIIDDGYIENDSKYLHSKILKKRDLLSQIEQAGMILAEEEVMPREKIRGSDEQIFSQLKKRCLELIEKHPDKAPLFLDYLGQQEEENDVLENKVVCSTMVIKRKTD